MALTQDTAHETEAEAKLLTQFRASPILIALLKSYINEIQDAENGAWGTYRSRFIDEATGPQLDLLGAVVGQARNGQADEIYRAYIKLRIFINKSSGTADALLYTVQAVMADAEEINIEDEPIASFVLRFTHADLTLISTLADLVGSVRAAGVGGQIVYSDLDGDALFQFSDSSSLVTGDTSKGFADTAQTTGGKLTGVVVI